MNITEAVEAAEEADSEAEEEDEEKRGEKKSTEPFFAPTTCTTIMLRSTRLRNCSSRVSYRRTTRKCLKKCLSLPCQLSECSESRSTKRNYFHCDQEKDTMTSAAVMDFGPGGRKGYFYESVGGVYYTLGKLVNFEPKNAYCRHGQLIVQL